MRSVGRSDGRSPPQNQDPEEPTGVLVGDLACETSRWQQGGVGRHLCRLQSSSRRHRVDRTISTFDLFRAMESRLSDRMCAVSHTELQLFVFFVFSLKMLNGVAIINFNICSSSGQKKRRQQTHSVATHRRTTECIQRALYKWYICLFVYPLFVRSFLSNLRLLGANFLYHCIKAGGARTVVLVPRGSTSATSLLLLLLLPPPLL